MIEADFCFYHIEKCAGSSLRYMFYNYFLDIKKKHINDYSSYYTTTYKLNILQLRALTLDEALRCILQCIISARKNRLLQFREFSYDISHVG